MLTSVGRDTLKSLLAELAEVLDAPDGIGGGAIVLMALAELEALERQYRPPEPSEGQSAH